MTTDAWRIQVHHPMTGEWITMKTRYAARKTAQSWLKFVKSYWHGAPVRTIQESTIRKQREKEAARD